MPQTDASVLRHQKKIEEGAQLVIMGTRGVGPSLIVLCGHVDPMEPNSKPLDGGYTADTDVLGLQLLFMDVILQWWQLSLHNWWQHWGAHARRGACESEMKLRDGDTQHIGEVYKLLLGFAGEELFEVVIDLRRRGSVLTHGHLKNSVHAGHSL